MQIGQAKFLVSGNLFSDTFQVASLQVYVASCPEHLRVMDPVWIAQTSQIQLLQLSGATQSSVQGLEDDLFQVIEEVVAASVECM